MSNLANSIYLPPWTYTAILHKLINYLTSFYHFILHTINVVIALYFSIAHTIVGHLDIQYYKKGSVYEMAHTSVVGLLVCTACVLL